MGRSYFPRQGKRGRCPRTIVGKRRVPVFLAVAHRNALRQRRSLAHAPFRLSLTRQEEASWPPADSFTHFHHPPAPQCENERDEETTVRQDPRGRGSVSLHSSQPE